MCGISGFNWRDEIKIKEMVSSLSYRGPDANGFFLDEGVSLGHDRLGIIDLSVGAGQPMSDNLDEITIVFNGEIYNFEEIREELKEEYEFRTKGDTEVILAGYRKWGNGVVDRLNGMFAFAIWDKRDNSLFCARDHMGMKPFYYFWDGNKFIFASEISALLVHNLPRKLNIEAFNYYFRVLYSPGSMTLIKDIYKLPPFHTLLLKDGVISISSYDKIPTDKVDISYRRATLILKEKVLASIKRHLVADVPVGVYLSGGIDSSVVLASMSRFHEKIKTFSVGFRLKDGEEGGKFNQDLELAKRTAKFFGAEHNHILVSVDDVIASMGEMMAHNSDPISNPTAVAMLLLSKFTKNKATVVLTGNAGDELWGGYERYRITLGAYYYKMLPKFVRSILNKNKKISKLDYKDEVDLFSQFMFEKDEGLSQVICPSFFEKDVKIKKYFQDQYFSSCRADIVECLMDVDQKSWLPDHFFMLSDKMSMASAIEERMPLADRELLTFSKTIPTSYKVGLFRTKKILKDAFKDDLPDYLFKQPKRGWFSPAAKWFRDPKFEIFVREVLSENYYLGTKKLFNWVSVERMLDDHISKKKYNLTVLWAILVFQMWAKQYQIEV
jgi:asparagine synthase (glutamine-hydrolysing)